MLITMALAKRTVVSVAIGLTALPLFLLGFIMYVLNRIKGHADARENPLNLFIASSIRPRPSGRVVHDKQIVERFNLNSETMPQVGVWSNDELGPSIGAFRKEVADGGWRRLRDEYHK